MLLFLGSIGSHDPYEDCSLPPVASPNDKLSFGMLFLGFSIIFASLSLLAVFFGMPPKPVTPDNSPKITTKPTEPPKEHYDAL